MKVAIVIPSALTSYLKDFETSYRDAITYLQARIEDLPFKIEMLQDLRPDKFPIDANRNHAAAIILENGFDTSIWLDADQTFPKNTLFRLLMNQAYPVISGVYHLKAKPFYPILLKEKPDSGYTWFKPIYHYPDDFFYADAIGMGCVKIDRCVFEGISKLYKEGEKIEFFRYLENPITVDFVDENASQQRKNDAKLHEKYLIRDVSEDIFFCKQVRDAGYKIVVDPGIQCGHISKLIVDKELSDNFYQMSMQMIQQRDQETYKYIQDNLCRVEAIKKQS